MEIFGIGPLELLLIVLIALIVLGPKEMMKTAQKTAEWLRKLRQSELWNSTKEVMDIPNQVMRETGLDKEIKELQNITKKPTDVLWSPSSTPTTPTKTEDAAASPDPENKILPAAAEKPIPDDSTEKNDQ
jgi:Sec-independent protein secretion pathway components